MIFCPSCGKQLSDEESTGKFCPHCGATIANGEAPQGNDFNQTLNNVKEGAASFVNKAVDKAESIPAVNNVLGKVDKKFRPVVLIAPIVALVLIVVLIFSGLFSSGYMSPINDYLKLVNKEVKDPMKFEKVTSSKDEYEVTKLMVSKIEEYEDSMKEREESWEDYYDDLNDEFKSWKVSFKKEKVEKQDKDTRKDLEEEYEDSYKDYYKDQIDELEDTLDDKDELEDMADEADISKSEAKKIIKAQIKYLKSFKNTKVSDVYEIKGKFVIKADKDKWESKTVRLEVAKVNGSWVYRGYEEIVFDDDDEELAMFSRVIEHFGSFQMGSSGDSDESYDW